MLNFKLHPKITRQACSKPFLKIKSDVGSKPAAVKAPKLVVRTLDFYWQAVCDDSVLVSLSVFVVVLSLPPLPLSVLFLLQGMCVTGSVAGFSCGSRQGTPASTQFINLTVKAWSSLRYSAR